MDNQQILLDNMVIGAKIAEKYFNRKVSFETLEDTYFLIFLLSVLLQGAVTSEEVETKIIEVMNVIEND